MKTEYLNTTNKNIFMLHTFEFLPQHFGCSVFNIFNLLRNERETKGFVGYEVCLIYVCVPSG